MKQLHLMAEDEEEEIEFADVQGKQDEVTSNIGVVVDMSFHTLSSGLKRKTITLQQVMRSVVVNVLVDTGSSDSFISHSLAKDSDD